MPPPTTPIAAAVRSGERSARDVVEQHLAAIDAPRGGDPRLQHRARRRGPRRRRRDRRRRGGRARPRSARRRARSRSRTTCARGASPTTCSSRILDGSLAVRRHRGRAAAPPPARCSSARPTSTSSRWARRPRTRRSGRRAIPGGPDARAGRIERRLGGRGRGGHRAARARQRHGRLDPPAGVALRRRRREADLRARLALRARRVRVASTRSARSRAPSPTRRWRLEVIGGHDPHDSTSLPSPPDLIADARRRRRGPARRACRASTSRRGSTPEVLTQVAARSPR